MDVVAGLLQRIEGDWPKLGAMASMDTIAPNLEEAPFK